MTAEARNRPSASHVRRAWWNLNRWLFLVVAASAALDASLPWLLSHVHPCAEYVEADPLVIGIVGAVLGFASNLDFGLAALVAFLLRRAGQRAAWTVLVLVAAVGGKLASVYASPYWHHLLSEPEVLCD